MITNNDLKGTDFSIPSSHNNGLLFLLIIKYCIINHNKRSLVPNMLRCEILCRRHSYVKMMLRVFQRATV